MRSEYPNVCRLFSKSAIIKYLASSWSWIVSEMSGQAQEFDLSEDERKPSLATGISLHPPRIDEDNPDPPGTLLPPIIEDILLSSDTLLPISIERSGEPIGPDEHPSGCDEP